MRKHYNPERWSLFDIALVVVLALILVDWIDRMLAANAEIERIAATQQVGRR